MRHLNAATALAGVLSCREFASLRIEYGKPSIDLDHDVIYLPGVPFGEMPDDVRQALRAYLAHEAGERAISSGWIKKKVFRTDELARLTMNALNDCRVDAWVRTQWAGSGLALDALVRSHCRDWLQRPPLSMLSVLCGLRYYGSGWCTLQDLLDTPLRPYYEVIRDLIDPLHVEHSSEAAVQVLALQIVERLRPFASPESAPEQPEPGPESSDRLESESESRLASSGREESDDEGEGSSGDSEDAQETSSTRRPKQPGAASTGRPNEGGKGDESDERGTPSEGSTSIGPDTDSGLPLRTGDDNDRTPEEAAFAVFRQVLGDPDSGLFTAPPMRLVDVHPPPSIEASALDSNPEHLVAARRLAASFAAVRSCQARTILSGQSQGELDPDRLGALFAGRDDAFYRRGRAVIDSLVVHLSIDLTASTTIMTKGYESQLATVVRACYWAGIPISVSGWTGTTPHRHGKGFTQPYVGEVCRISDRRHSLRQALGRLASAMLRYRARNADVQGLSYGLAALLNEPEARKVLLYVTDGMPCVDGQPPEAQRLLLGALQRIVAQCRRLGVVVVCLGIGAAFEYTSPPKNIVSIFGADGFARVGSTWGNLAREVGRVLRRELQHQALRS